jgi:F-type H+-transporting ATPase subunit epsilon
MLNPSQFALEIVTPEGRLTTAEVDLVEFPSSAGDLGIYAGHTPLLVALGVGELRVYLRDEVQTYAVAGGCVQARPDFVRIAAIFASPGEEESRIEQACQRAQAALETAANEPAAVIQAELADLRLEMVKMAEDRRKKRNPRGR